MQTPAQTQQDSDERARNPFARLDHGLTPFTLSRLRERAERGRSAGYRVVDITPNHLQQLLDIAEGRSPASGFKIGARVEYRGAWGREAPQTGTIAAGPAFEGGNAVWTVTLDSGRNRWGFADQYRLIGDAVPL